MYYQKRDNKYRYYERYIDVNTGKTKTVSITLDDNKKKTQKEAETILRSKIEEALTKDISRKELSLSEVLELYLQDKKDIERLKESTLRRNRSRLTTFISYMGEDTLINKLTPDYVIRKLYEASNNNPHTFNEALIRFKAFLNYAYIHEYIDVDFTKKLQPIKETEKKSTKDKYLEPEELEKLLTYFKDNNLYEWYYLTQLLTLTGMRIGEALALNDCDIDEEHIHITKTIDLKTYNPDSPKTENSIRDIDIQEELIPIIRSIRLYMKEKKLKYNIQSKLFMFNNDGKHLQYGAYNKCIRQVSEKVIGKRITPHTLRHTHTSMLASNGVDIETISRRLGHKDSDITKEVYLHITEQLKENDRKKLMNIRLLSS